MHQGSMIQNLFVDVRGVEDAILITLHTDSQGSFTFAVDAPDTPIETLAQQEQIILSAVKTGIRRLMDRLG